MNIFKQIENRFYKFLILLVFSLSLLIITDNYFRHGINAVKITKRIQNKISQKDSEISKIINQISFLLQSNSDSLFLINNFLEEKFSTQGFLFLVHKSDSLIYWSNNSSPFPVSILDTTTNMVNTGNAWYRIMRTHYATYTISGLYLIKNEYAYQNEYLENNFHSSILNNYSAIVSIKPQTENIFSNNGEFLFSLNFTKDIISSDFQFYSIFLLYLITIISFIGLINEFYKSLLFRYRNRQFYIPGFILLILLIRIVLFYLRYPTSLYSTDLFGPQYYAHSDLFPSLGDYVLNVASLLLIAIYIFKNLKFNLSLLKLNILSRTCVILLAYSITFVLLFALEFTFESLILDSNISMDLYNIFSINQISVIKFLLLSGIVLSFFLITSKIYFIAFRLRMNIFQLALCYGLVLLVYFSLFSKSKTNDLSIISFLIVYFMFLTILYHYKITKFSISNIVFFLLLFSFYSTYNLNKYNSYKENENLKLIVGNLAVDQKDVIAEYLFNELNNNILRDTIISNLIHYYQINNTDDKSLKTYISETYFSDYWKKFNQQITICEADDYLIIQPQNISIACNDFFNDMISRIGSPTQNPNMYFVNYDPGDNGYLLHFKYNCYLHNKLYPVNIFVELTPKYVTKELGFPDLLVNQTITKSADLSNYSYAKYFDGHLMKRVGKFAYRTNISEYGNFDTKYSFFSAYNYQHLLYNFDAHNKIIISKKQKSILDLFAPFSYMFLFYGLLLFIIYFGYLLIVRNKTLSLNFSSKLQLSMVALLLLSFLVIGISSVQYIKSMNDQKNNDILNEKIHSVLVELQQKLSNEQFLNPNNPAAIDDLLVKFSSVFFTDINLFDLEGNIFSTSRPQIFEEFLIGNKMNTTAFRQLKFNKSSLYIQTENIGRQNYLSAYIPFFNNNNTIIGYLNLPYFAKQNDLKREISTFLVAYINIYVILIALSIILALIISNYISRPIKLIMYKISQINLGGKNEKINWLHKDEIGQLVLEYNRMIDELALSAELLAKSERESAWREMAKQVAHEIKNPLTPMKLNVQYLQKAWNDKAPLWDQRLGKFTQTMIDQIDTLSSIASAFADFAQMPASKQQKIDINDVIENSIGLFKNYNNIHFNLTSPQSAILYVFADKEQLLRAFNNLFKNAVQAIDEFKNGAISINTFTDDIHCIIEISDNGKGIEDEFKDKVFYPNFTTKSGGMGLGLAIVKNIIEISGGEISYTSQKGRGTTFKIMLPLAR